MTSSPKPNSESEFELEAAQQVWQAGGHCARFTRPGDRWWLYGIVDFEKVSSHDTTLPDAQLTVFEYEWRIYRHNGRYFDDIWCGPHLISRIERGPR